MPDLDAMNPEMQQQEPATLGIPNGEADHEGAMAKADLYKLANYSFKLFKKLEDDAQLEAWVQAKITKAADYIASVYHYLEYEMKFNDYGQQLDNSDVMSESQKRVLKNKLMEAKAKMKELKKVQAEKVKEASEHKSKDEFDNRAKEGDTYKTAKGGEVTKTKSGIKHEKKYSDSYKGHGNTKDSELDESDDKRPATKKTGERDVELPSGAKVKARTYQGHQSQKADKESDKEKKKDLGEAKGKKPDFLDMDKDGDKKEPMKKAVADKKKNPFAKKDEKVAEAKTCNETAKGKSCPVHGLKECGTMEEAAKPSAGLSKSEKSAVVKKAKAGGDIGKPGKSFDKVAKAAGGGEKGKKIAAAAMWKNVKESVKVAEANKKAKPDFLDMDKDGDKNEPMKKAVADKKEVVKESADTTRIRELMQRLNG